MESKRGGARVGAGRKRKGDIAVLHCRIRIEAKERLQQIAQNRNTSITSLLEDLIQNL